jgi:hypothetical protein
MGVHCAWNVVQGPVFGSTISGSGHARGWLESTLSGPEWLAGGTFGLEASVVAMAVSAPVAAALLIAARRRGLLVAPWWIRRRRLTDGAPAAPAAPAV